MIKIFIDKRIFDGGLLGHVLSSRQKALYEL